MNAFYLLVICISSIRLLFIPDFSLLGLVFFSLLIYRWFLWLWLVILCQLCMLEIFSSSIVGFKSCLWCLFANQNLNIPTLWVPCLRNLCYPSCNHILWCFLWISLESPFWCFALLIHLEFICVAAWSKDLIFVIPE